MPSTRNGGMSSVSSESATTVPEKEVGAGLIDVDDDGHGCAHKHVLGGLGHSRNEQARDHYHDGGLEPEGHGKGSGARKGTPHESGEACRHYGQLRKAP